MRTDSTAAIGIAYRNGLGRTRHIRVQYLWMQEKLSDEELKLEKVAGTINNADLMTKHVKREDKERHMKAMGLEVRSGRSEASLTINAVQVGGDRWYNRQGMLDETGGDQVELHTTVMKIDEGMADNIVEYMRHNANWLRQHRNVRRALFTPMKVAKGPQTER